MTPEQAVLVERLRTLLADEPVVREVSMFGGRSFMVNEKMVVSALRDGGLLVRVAASQHEALLARPGTAQAEMGSGRSMGPGWIEVRASALDGPSGEEVLSSWLALALEHSRVVVARERQAGHAVRGGRCP